MAQGFQNFRPDDEMMPINDGSPRPWEGSGSSLIQEIQSLSNQLSDARGAIVRVSQALSRQAAAFRGITSDDITIRHNPADDTSYWEVGALKEFADDLVAAFEDIPLTVYIDDSGRVKVRPGRAVWTQTIPSEEIIVQDPSIEYNASPSQAPSGGTMIVAVKLIVLHEDDVPFFSIHTTMDSADEVYKLNTSDNGNAQLERYWPLAAVDSSGGVTKLRAGGDILELRQG
jgi:hypothetical protein|tara:strand:+ start:34 stop:720 length:687 start_codon:yes stop_codon:yes gene_type:complete